MHRSFFLFAFLMLVIFLSRMIAQPCDPSPQFKGIASSEDVLVSISAYSQSEVSIAIDPNNPNNLLLGMNSGPISVNPIITKQGYYYSLNGGSSWAGSHELPGTGNITSDPAVAYDANGNAYFNYIEQPGQFWDLRIKKSTDKGVTWGSALTIPGVFNADKNHMAIDITNNVTRNYIYLAYSDANKIYFSRSTDGGNSFTSAVSIDGSFPGRSRGVNLAVGPNRQVYAVWAIGPDVLENNFGIWSILDDWGGEAAETDLVFNRSTDGGSANSWSGAQIIQNIQGIKGLWDHKNMTGHRIRVNSFPSMAVDHSGGIWHSTIYLVWTDKSLYGDPDIVLSKSTDGGITWSNPLRVNDDPPGNGIDQWFPWITVNPYGVINIVFYDSRNDPNNRYTEVWVAQSGDGGASFTNFRVSDNAFMPCPIEGAAFGYMGDYIGITSTAGKAYPAWMEPGFLFEEAQLDYDVYFDEVDTYQAGLEALAYSNRSLNADATAANNGRRLVRDGSGNYHLVFGSGGEVFYRKNSAGTWQTPQRLSSGNGANHFPCISEYNGKLYAVWQRQNGGNYDIYFATSQNDSSSWAAPYVLAGTAAAQDPLPVIQANVTAQTSLVVTFYNGSNLRSYNTTNANPGSGNWNSKTVTGTGSGSINPSLAGAKHYWNGSSLAGLAYEAGGEVYYQYFDPNAGATGSWSGSPINLSAIVPGSAADQKPSLSGMPNSSALQVAWHRVYGSGGSIYDHRVIHRKSNGFDSWSSQYSEIMYAMSRPSLAATASNKAFVVFQEPFDNNIYKTTYNGTSWSSPFIISYDAQDPSLSAGSTQAKYVYTKNNSSPYDIVLGSEVLSKTTGEDETLYSRAVNWIAPEGEYLQVRVAEFAFVQRDQGRERLDFSDAFDSLSITPGNAWDFLQAERAAVPVDADSLVVAFSLEAEGLENLLQPGDLKPRALLRIVAAGEPDQEIARLTTPPLPDAGDIAKTNFRFSLPLRDLNAGEIIASLRVDNIAPKAATVASLGHIYDFTGLAAPGKSAERETVAETMAVKDYRIETAYPNPFNPEITIRYHLPQPALVSIKVYNILGEHIRTLVNETVSQGIHEAQWDGRSESGQPAGSGIYLLRMVASSADRQIADVQKIILTR